MAYRYTYNNETYSSLYALRKAIWEQQKLLYGKPQTQEDFNKIPALKDKVAVVKYNPEDELTADQKASRIRAKRDSLMTQSDFYVMPDYPSDPDSLAIVKTYRQTLRDITNQETFPESVEWPDVPVVLLKGKQKEEAMALGLDAVAVN